MTKREQLKQWLKDHRVEIIIGSISVGLGLILLYSVHTSTRPQVYVRKQEPVLNHEPTLIEKETFKTIIPESILENLTGNKLTATELGYRVWKSPQEINKRIVDAGLADRLPCGIYVLTEAGEKVGEEVVKTTRAGHTFSNMEWDEAILPFLFSQQELDEIYTRHASIVA